MLTGVRGFVLLEPYKRLIIAHAILQVSYM